MWFRRRNSVSFSNSDIPPAHIAPSRSVPEKTPPPSSKAPTKLTKARPPVPKDTTTGINEITWPLQRGPVPAIIQAPTISDPITPVSPVSYPYEEFQGNLLQDHWGYTPSIVSMTAPSTRPPSQYYPNPPLPPPPPVPHFSRPKIPTPIHVEPRSPQPQFSTPRYIQLPPQSPQLEYTGAPYTPPPTSPLPDISASPSFRAVSPTQSRPDGSDSFSLNRNSQWTGEYPSQPVSPISSTFSGQPVSPRPQSFSRPRAPTPQTMASDPYRPAPLRVSKQYSPTTTTPSSGLSPTESFSSPLHTRMPSRNASTRFNPNPPNDLARSRSVRNSQDMSVGRPRASTQPTMTRLPTMNYRPSPPASPVPRRHERTPVNQTMPPPQMVHQRSISSPTPQSPNTSSLRTHTRSPSSPVPNVRKQKSASSMSIAIESADEDAISALEEAVEDVVSRPSLSSDRTSGSSYRPVSPLTPTMSPADAPVVTPRAPSPSNSARPTSPTCSVRPVSPTQFLITETPRGSSPVPSMLTVKTVYSIPEEGTIDSDKSSNGRPLSPSSTHTADTFATSLTNSNVSIGSMPTFPSRHEAKKARKAYQKAQEEARRQSAKMGVEGVLGWDAGKRAWVCKMSDEEKREWLEKMTDGKEGKEGRRGSREWGRGLVFGMGVGRGRNGSETVGMRGLGVKVVDVN